MEQPRWGDLDVNQHVNNVKYIGWILEVIYSGPLHFSSYLMVTALAMWWLLSSHWHDLKVYKKFCAIVLYN